MTTERWQQLKSVLEQLDMTPEAGQKQLLAHLLDSDPALYQEVQPFLNPSGEDAFIHDMIGQQASSLRQDGSRQTRFGHYQTTRRIGQGGMGAVFEAVRVDDFHKKVALKVIQQGLDSDLARARFVQERQVLASLEHPYIARLLDGGETEDGSPYLVLELVEGEPVTQYCAKLGLNARLHLFLKICAAVEHAHRNLVVHRDLKPANILVTADGDPKLLDFGIAKLLDAGSARTQTGFAALTPDYASPEQVRGETITTASDVYSLGVILYQILTGRKLYSVDAAAPLEMDRIVCQEPPSPPKLGDELDYILLMALRKEPPRRYQSVLKMAEDIERYLANRPVTARPDTLRYRTAKFVRRNWWQLAAVSAMIVSLGAGLGFSIAGERRAQRRFNQVRQLAGRFLFQFHDEIVDIPGTTKARKMVVSTALEYLDSLSADSNADSGLARELAEAYKRIGDVQGHANRASVGDTRTALESYRKALAIARRISAESPQDVEALRMVVRMELAAGESMSYSGDTKSAQNATKNADAVEKRIRELDPGNPKNKRELAEILVSFARDESDKNKSMEYASKAIGILEELAKGAPDDEVLATELANAYSALGSGLNLTGRTQEAYAEYLKILAIRERQNAAAPNKPKAMRELMIAESHIGDILGSPAMNNLGDLPGALRHYRRMVEIAAAIQKADRENGRAAADYGIALQRLANVLIEVNLREGVEVFRQSLQSLEKQMAVDGGNISGRLNAVFVLGRIGDGLEKLGDFPGAEANFHRALELGQPSFKADPKDVKMRRVLIGVYQSLINYSGHRGRPSAVESNCQSALQLGKEVIRLDPNNIKTLGREPRLLFACGEAHALAAKQGPPSREAAIYFQRSAEAWRKLEGKTGWGASEQADMKRALARGAEKSF